jgi:3-deoxy-D-manno-octulosonic-acid transferase
MLLYRIFIWLYPIIARLMSLGNAKAALWVRGRKKLFEKLSSAFYKNPHPVIWIHCASLGEFEQGLPVLEGLKSAYPNHQVLLTFFSPSGYEIRKDYKGADHIFYLPMDSPRNADRFLDIVQPSLVIFIKYEFWFYYLKEIRSREIPLLLVSGIFREDQPFFKWYGSLHCKILSSFSWLLVQNESAARLLASIGYTEQVIVSGDTRFDRVISIAEKFEPIPVIEQFCGAHPTIVAGSTWTEDDEELDHFANTHPEIRCIIAPHVIEAERLEECLQLYKHSMLFSDYQQALEKNEPIPANLNVLIIDNMGMLSRLYHYATIAYVGGGFGDDGIHNILEAAVYQIPVVFGPVFDKYAEAEEMIDQGGAFFIEDALELEKLLQELLERTDRYTIAARAAGNYVTSKAGATEKVLGLIQEKRLLTS